MTTTTIKEVMSTSLVMTEPSTSVAQAATVMGASRVSALLVADAGTLVAIFTERDVLHALSQDFGAAETPISHWMTTNPVTTSPSASVEDGLHVMLSGGFRHLPVVETDGSLVGVVSIRDLGRAIADH